MKKYIIFLLGFCLWKEIYPITTINFTRQLVVIYKVLDPLSVIVDSPEKMVVRAGNQTFKYSEVTSSRAPLNIKIETPYKQRDEILDQIYGTATLELENKGEFVLVDEKASNNTIRGRGFFVSNSASQLTLPLYNASTPDKYQASTVVDAIFNEDKNEMLMGNYRGVLILNVTYGA